MIGIAVLSGFGVGAIVGMTGVGGGSLMTPLLMSVFRLHPALAIGTDLWFAGLTKTSGAIAHHRHGQVDWRIAKLLLAGSIPASLATIALMHLTGLGQGWSSALTLTLGIALLLTALTVAPARSVFQALPTMAADDRPRTTSGVSNPGKSLTSKPPLASWVLLR